MDNSEEATTRRVLLDLLRLIADKQQQLAYERDVPIANVPAELVCMWFNDQYHPTSEWFREAFTPEEIERLRTFSEFYDARLGALPQSGSVTELHRNPLWDEIVAKAKQTLRSFDEEDI